MVLRGAVLPHVQQQWEKDQVRRFHSHYNSKVSQAMESCVCVMLPWSIRPNQFSPSYWLPSFHIAHHRLCVWTMCTFNRSALPSPTFCSPVTCNEILAWEGTLTNPLPLNPEIITFNSPFLPYSELWRAQHRPTMIINKLYVNYECF